MKNAINYMIKFFVLGVIIGLLFPEISVPWYNFWKKLLSRRQVS